MSYAKNFHQCLILLKFIKNNKVLNKVEVILLLAASLNSKFDAICFMNVKQRNKIKFSKYFKKEYMFVGSVNILVVLLSVISIQ